MGADQFDAFDPKERVHKLSFFNWWMFSIFFGALLSATFLVYIQDHVGWNIGYAVPTIGLMVAVAVFIVGTPNYRHKPPSESPLTWMAKVLVAAVRKRNVVVPDDPEELHELSLGENSSPGKHRIDHTYSIRFLDKAAVKNGPTSPWMQRSVAQVEETKQMVKMLPVLVASFIPSTLLAQTQTLYIKQGTTLVRSMGPNFDIPLASLSAVVTFFMLISIIVYDKLFVPAIRRYTKNPRGITLLQRMGIGIVLGVIIMLVASFIERYRLRVARENGIVQKNQTVPLTNFILLPQFALTGIADNFVEVAKIDFFYDQSPEAIKSLGTALYTTSFGVGYFLGSFLLSTVADITKSNGHNGWILDNLNVSHLDYYYAFYVVLSSLNLLFFIVVSNYFVYNTYKTEAIGPSPEEDN